MDNDYFFVKEISLEKFLIPDFYAIKFVFSESS